jgi:23S rRNA (uracil1939-C5)-methyltransferase
MDNEIFTIQCEKMVYGGECLGRLPDGRAVFVPFTLPNEVVEVALVEDKPRYARAWPIRLIQKSPDRIEPRCIHFGECGGGQYHHIDYAKQIGVKSAILKDQFQRIAKINAPLINPLVPSPDHWNYRNYIQFHIGRNAEIGYIHADGKHLLPIKECYLPQPPINALWPQISLDPAIDVTRLGIRIDTYKNMMLILEGDEPAAPPFSIDIPISAVYTPPDANLTVLAGDDHLAFNIKGRDFQVSARSFFQVNTVMAEKMIDFLLENLDLQPNSNAIELFSGVGLFSAFIAPQVAALTAIEISGSACHDFAVNLDEFDNVSVYEAPVEDVVPSLTQEFDILVMDPPRAGLAPRVHDAIAQIKPKQIAYISCDPATLARDINKILKKGYKLISVTPFDLFPQTAHIETMSLLLSD